jgi:ketosteroid isomerase-like protein
MNVISKDHSEIRKLIEEWALAVRNGDYPSILAHHSDDIVMFDVPPPFESQGIDEYRKTWDLFLSNQPKPVKFDIQRLDIVAGSDVGFAFALMQCQECGADGELNPLDFRLTIGLRKFGEHWAVVHEHHSVPASD